MWSAGLVFVMPLNEIAVGWQQDNEDACGRKLFSMTLQFAAAIWLDIAVCC